MAFIEDRALMKEAAPGDTIILGSYTRIKLSNGMWGKVTTVDGVAVEKISKTEIHSLGFVLGEEAVTVDTLAELGVTIEPLEFGDIGVTDDVYADYGNLEIGSDTDVEYGSL